MSTCRIFLLAIVYLAATVSVQAALQLKLEAANYDAGTGTWTDSSGNNNHATQATPASRPSLVAGQTANGSPVVRFDGANDHLDLTSVIPTSGAAGYTIFVYIRPNVGFTNTVVSGTLGSLQYRAPGNKQQFVKTFVVNLGSGTGTLSATNFNSINGRVNNAGGAFRLNGVADGTPSGNSFSPGISAIGRNDQSDTELLSGDIAEIRIYDEQLLPAAIEAVEAELVVSHGFPGLQLRLEAENYDPQTGTWTDSSPLGNDASQATAASRPSLVANQTDNGLPAVRFDGVDDFLALGSAISTTGTDGFTVLAFLRPRTGNRTIVAGGVGSFQHRINGLLQQVTEASQASRGTGSTALSTVAFSSVMAQGNSAGGSFCLNGTPDGAITAQAFSPYEAISHVGSRSGGVESYSGDIVEIRVYNQQLPLFAIQAIEAEFLASYETITNAVSLPNIANPTFDIDVDGFTAFPGYINGGTNPSQITDWPGPGVGGRGINPGNGAGTPFRNNGDNAGQVAFIQRIGTISQVTSGWEIGKSYRLTFDYNARTTPAASLSATIDGVTFTDPSVPNVGGSFGYYAANLLVTPTTTTPTLSVSNLNGANDNTLLLDNFRVFRTGPAIADNGFELPVQPNNNWKQANGGGGGDLTGSAWTITAGAGISRNISPFQNGGEDAAEGEQLALIQGNGSFVQTVTGFNPGADYELSLLATRRGGAGSDLEVVLDAGLASEVVLIDIPEITSPGFQEETGSFMALKESYTLTIRASNNGGLLAGDRTTFIDNVWFNLLTLPTRTVFRFR
jgi:hypothetical protein